MEKSLSDWLRVTQPVLLLLLGGGIVVWQIINP